MADQDTLMKALTRSLSGGALEAVGVHGVELTEPVPTELPATTMRMDAAWRMIDGRIFHLEFQSTREPNLYRFLEYDVRLAQHHTTQIRTVVLYHADTIHAPDALDIGTAQYHVENVFLSQLDGTQALTTVQAHLAAGRWEPPDRLRLALALNMHFSDRTDVLNTVLTLVSAVPSMTERDLVVSAMIILGNYALTGAERTRLRKELRKMSTIAEELLRDEHEEGLKEGEQIGIQKGEQIGIQKVAQAMLAAGDSVEKVMTITGLTRAAVDALKAH